MRVGDLSVHAPADGAGPSASSGRLAGVNVLFVLPTLRVGGAERQALLLAEYLKQREDARVSVVGMSGKGEIADRCDALSIPWTTFPLQHLGKGWTRKVADLWRFIAFLRRNDVDVLLPYCMFENLLSGLSWELGGCQVCIWNQRDEGRQRSARWLEQLAVARTRCFVSNSEHGARFLCEVLGIPPARVHIVHNGTVLAPPAEGRAEWRRRLGLRDEDVLACMIANLQRFKDHKTLVAAWRLVVDRLRTAGLGAHLLLAGAPGDRYEKITAQIADLRLDAHVHLLGFVRDISGLLSAVDLAVFSSTGEGLPNAILEAMASGTPVVATDDSGIREALGPGGWYRLARPGDPTDLADRIVEVALDPAFRARAGRKARARVQEEFGVDRMGDSMASLILAQASGAIRRRPHAALNPADDWSAL